MNKSIVINCSTMLHNKAKMQVHTHSSQLNSQLALQNSDICALSMSFLNDRPLLQSFSLKNIILNDRIQAEYSQALLEDDKSRVNQLKQPLFKVLSLKRGMSQNFQQFQNLDHSINDIEQIPTYLGSSASLVQFDWSCLRANKLSVSSTCKNYENLASSKYLSNQDDKSEDNLYSTSNFVQLRESSKNVTKNMGKMLFRFIWKNKDDLRQKLKVEKQKWYQFIAMVKQLKKQNNITRQFLRKLWDGQQSQYSKLFRIISHNFFHKRFYQLLFESGIKNKQMHLQRRYKFQQGIRDTKALDNLN